MRPRRPNAASPGTPALARSPELVPVGFVRPLRLAVLRPGRPPEAAVWPGDDDPLAGHVAVFDDGGRVVAVGSVVPEEGGFRVRGMATDPSARGRGLGALVLDALVHHARAQGAEVIWASARLPAVTLYERAGFAPEGEDYEVPGIGPHRRMVLP
jgi:GNAT superfamily N-acetyltransferase